MTHFAFVSFEVKPVAPGGVGTFIASIVRRLLEDGHRVTLLLDIPDDAFRKWNQEIREFPNSGLLSSFLVSNLCADGDFDAVRFPSEAHRQSLRFAHATAKVHAIEPIDYIEFVDYCGAAYYTLVLRLFFPQEFPSRIAVRLHNTIEVIVRRDASGFPDFRIFDFALERTAISLADRILTPGRKFWSDECASLYPAVEERRIEYSPPVRDYIERQIEPGEGVDIAYVGRASTFKGMDRILGAAVRVLNDPETSSKIGSFLIIGPGEGVSSSQSENDLMKLASLAPPGRIKMMGRLSEEEILECFQHSMLAVFPNRMESFCYAAHEAHLAGVPLIVSKTPAFEDHFVDGESAIFFDNSIGDLAAKIKQCINDVELRKRLSLSVESRRSNYSTHFYSAHAKGDLFNQVAKSSIGIAILVIDGNPNTSDRKLLKSQIAAAEIYYLCPDLSGTLTAFGSSWTVRNENWVGLAASEVDLPGSVAFTHSVDKAFVAFAQDAVEALQREERVGAIVPSRIDHHGRRYISHELAKLDTLVPESLLNAVVRTSKGATLADLCADNSAFTERSLLINNRRQKLAIVDCPHHHLTETHGGVLSPATHAAHFTRYAWYLAPDQLGQLAGATAATEKGDERLAEQNMLSDTQPSSQALTISVPAKTSAGATNRFTLLSVRTEKSLRVPFDKLIRAGTWKIIDAPDRPDGLLVGEFGTLQADVPDPEIFVLTGPDQGEATFSLGTRAISIDLNSPRYWQISARLGELLDQFDGLMKPSTLITSTTISNPQIADDLKYLLRSGAVNIVWEQMEALFAASTQMAATTWIIPKWLHSDLRTIAQLIILACGADEDAGINIVGDRVALELVKEIVASSLSLKVNYVMLSRAYEHSSLWDWLLETKRAAQHYPDRLSLVSAAPLISDSLLGMGVECISIGIHPPKAVQVSDHGSVDIVIPHTPSDIPSVGHIAAAIASLTTDVRDQVRNIYVADTSFQALLILEHFGISHRVHRFSDVAELLIDLREKRFIYCCPFPSGAFDPICLNVLRQGGLVLVAHGGIAFSNDFLKEHMTVDYWEDSELLKAKLLGLIEEYPRLNEAMLGS